MASMHASFFIRPEDLVYATSMAHEETKSFSVTVRVVGEESSEVALFADSLDQLAAFGRAIVAGCEQLAAGPANLPNEADQSAVTHDFRPGAYDVNAAIMANTRMTMETAAIIDQKLAEDDHPF